MAESDSPFTNLDFDPEKLTGRPGCVVQDGYIVLDGDYPIELERCNTPEKVLGWIEQLGDKLRFQPFPRDFVLMASRANGFEIGYGM